jgi:hypothetical protein
MKKKKYPKPQVIAEMPIYKIGNDVYGFEISVLSEEEQADLKKLKAKQEANKEAK